MALLLIHRFSKIVTFKATLEQIKKLQLDMVRRDLVNFDYTIIKFEKYPGFSEVKKIGDKSNIGWVLPNICLYHKK